MDVWEDTKSLAHRLKIERTLNFTTMSHEEDDYSSYSQKKIARDPMSHRIIEKRRRDRMNNCLADLSRLIPATYLKKGRGRIEKTEIIEMATKHLRHLQAHACKDPATCEVSSQLRQHDEDGAERPEDARLREETALRRQREQHRLGFQECSSETVRFLVEVEGFYPGQGVCLRLLHHLQQHYDKLVQGMCYMGGEHHGDPRDQNPQGSTHHHHHHQQQQRKDDNHVLTLDCNSNQSLCESYAKQTNNHTNHTNIVGHSRSLKRSASQISDCPSNSVEVLRLNHSATDRLGSVRTDEDVDDDHSMLAASAVTDYGAIHQAAPNVERPPPRSHLRDILNQDSCPASYEQKRMRSNSIDSARSCKTTTGVVSSHPGYQAADIYSNRTPEEVYKFKNNIKERFRADVLHHNFDSGTEPPSQECVVAPASSGGHDAYSKLPTSESFGISRMFPSMSANGAGAGAGAGERSFATLNGFACFGVNGDLAVKIPSEATRTTDSLRAEDSGTVGTAVEHRSSRSSSCGSNASPSSLSSNCYGTHQTGASNGTHTSSAVTDKCSIGVGHSSTSGYSTSGEGSSITVSTRDKTTRNSSLSSGSPVPSRNHAENSPESLLKIEDHNQQSPTNSSSQSPRPEATSALLSSLVPIFALHPKGAFYVPLHVESAALTPLLRDRWPFLAERDEGFPLHPVNISVCFCPGRDNEGSLLSNWKAKNERQCAYESYRERMY